MKDREVDGCTFKPKTLAYSGTGRTTSSGDKCIDLYSRKQKGWFKEKAQKSAQEYEFERNKQDCTFKPKVNDPNTISTHVQNEETVQHIKGMDKVMDRMMKARQQQLEKKIMTERGMPSQIIASLGKPEPSMAFGSNTNKYKSGFGKDGS